MRIWISFILVMFVNAIFAIPTRLDNNANCVQIYKDISMLQLGKASNGISNELKVNPTNAFTVMLANYIDFYELFFNENANVYDERKQFEAKRINAIEMANTNSPYYLHSKAVIYLQWCCIKLKFKDYISGARDARKAFILFKENKEKYPDFVGGDALLGSMQAVIGSIPGNYQWIASILGMKGNLKNGSMLIENAMRNEANPFSTDALFAFVYLKQYLQNDPTTAWQVLKKYRKECTNNRMIAFLSANIGINQNKADEVIAIIQENANLNTAMQMPILDYEIATAYFYKLDKKSFAYYNKYLNNFKGKFYRKDTYYKMAMLAYLYGDDAMANQYTNRIIEQPSSEADADKNAQQFAKVRDWPSKELLKIRCLYDGGYFAQALFIAKNCKPTVNQQLEYHYRIARIFDETKQTDSAVCHYLKAIEIGKNQTSYFAARACLQLGILYENQNKVAKAKQYFAQSMTLKNKEYKNSIDMRAKAGLQRLNDN